MNATAWRLEGLAGQRYVQVVTTALPQHRRVLGVSGDREVLACGHQVPRFDATEAFARLMSEGRPAYPHLRRCPECPAKVFELPAAFALVDAPIEALMWWTMLALQIRAAWLDEVLPDQNTAVLRGKLPRQALPVRERDMLGEVLRTAHARAAGYSLTLREFSSLSPSPLPTLSGWALARAAARRYEAEVKV